MVPRVIGQYIQSSQSRAYHLGTVHLTHGFDVDPLLAVVQYAIMDLPYPFQSQVLPDAMYARCGNMKRNDKIKTQHVVFVRAISPSCLSP